MTVYTNLVFPLRLAPAFSGGPRRKNLRTQGASGFQVVNQVWANPLRRYDGGGSIETVAALTVARDFWEETRGGVHVFMVCDPFDGKSCSQELTPAFDDQTIGTGDGVETNFQLSKTYGTVNPYTENVIYPESGTVVVGVNGVEQGSGWTVSTTTGIVNFTVPPTNTHTVTAGYRRYIPCRFAIDDFDQVIYQYRARQVPQLPLIEHRE